MNMILLFKDDLIDENRAMITGRRLKHIRKVHRAVVGDQLRVGMINGLMGTGELLELDATKAILNINCTEQPPKPVPVTLLLGLPRPKVLRRTLETAITLGIKEIYLMKTWRVEKSFWQTPLLDQLDDIAHLGLEQARDTMMPNIQIRKLFKPFIEDELPTILVKKKGIIAHPGGDIITAITEPVVLAIGPEGGFIQYELDRFKALHFEHVGLGDRIQKVETAVVSAVSKLF